MVSFGLVMEHDKSEIFYFSRTYNNSNPELDLLAIGASILKPKIYWRYLGFYFDCCLFFKKHICYYSTKAMSTIKTMDMLRNSTRGLLPLQKQLLHCSCIITITTYVFGSSSLLEYLPRLRYYFQQLYNTRLLSGSQVHFTPHPLVKLRLQQVLFQFIFILKSQLSGLVSGLLLFLHNIH